MDRIYLDHAATTPLRPEVREVLMRTLASQPGNPSSPHAEGRAARAALESARRRVAGLLRVPPTWIVFTRGGTESDNLAILGRAGAHPERGIVVSSLEHAAVREPAAAAAGRGTPVTTVAVAPDGSPDAEALTTLLDREPGPGLVSMQLVNSETGLVLELDGLFRAAAARGVPVHVDAVQAAGRVPLPRLTRVDGTDPGAGASRAQGARAAHSGPSLVSLSAHKIGGPRGIGLLARDPDVTLAPILHGGRQEAGLRPGTEDVAAAAAFAEALALAFAEAELESPRLTALRDRLETGLTAAVPGIRVHGAGGRRAPHILSVGLPGVPRDLLPGALDLEGVAASAGSACRSGSSEPSAVLVALHGPDAARFAPLRLSLGRETRARDIEVALERIVPVLRRAVGAADHEALGATP
jgi:cysteine desulfurase